MADNTKIIVGLDIGTTKIVAIVARKNEFGKVEILGVGKSESLGVSRGVVSNIEKTVQSIQAAISEAESKSDVKIKVVNVGIAGQHIKSVQHRGQITRNNSEDVISDEDLKILMSEINKLHVQPGEEIVAVLPQEYIIDKEPGIKEPKGMSGTVLEANCHIITGLTSAINNIKRCLKTSNLEIAGLFLEPIASSEAVLSEEEKEAGVALIDIGGGTTDLAIFYDGIIRHTAVIPFGGNVITNDIKEGCSIIRRQAELLKIKFGSAISSENQESEIVSIPGLRGREATEISLRNLASIIQARMEEIIEHIYYEIKSSGYESQLAAGIVLTGGGALLKHLPQLVEYITGMYTRIGYPNEHLASDSFEELKSPIYATSIGLVIRGFQEDELKNKNNKSEQVSEEEVDQQEEPEKKSSKPKGAFFKNLIDKLIDDDV